MLGSLLTTKLYFPPVRPALVPRPRLVERLQMGLQGPLTLLSAPAGSGKTTLLSEWRAGAGAQFPLAWLSLDEGDNDPTRFFHHLAGSLDLLQPGALAEILPYLQSSERLDPQVLLTPLINALSSFPRDFLLALDDYHTIETGSIHAALAFLLDHLPARMHIALLTRADPPLPLSRLRARGHLTEIRAEHLRFNLEETAQFLQTVMHLNLRPDQVAALEKRTEGWIAGLHLAALSMQGREDVDGFVSAFTGSNHYIVDYLGEEVLARQPEALREFLLKTSLLERLTGGLCDALTGREDGESVLQELEHANVFVISLDKEQRWYRYHHLFGELLRNRLVHSFPEAVSGLHDRASAWFETQGFMAEAIDHALASRDYPNAARLFCKDSLEVMYTRSFTSLEHWLKAFPQAFLQEDPRLCIAMAHVLWSTGRQDQIPSWSAWAEKGLASRLTADPQISTGLEYQTFLGETFAFQSLQAQAEHRLEEAVELAQKAADLIPKTARNRAFALGSLYIANSMSGNIDKALEVSAEAVTLARMLDYPSMLSTGTYTLCHLLMVKGRVREAERVAKEALDHAAQHGQAGLFYYGLVHIALADICCERNELEAMETFLTRGLGMIRQGGTNILLINGLFSLATLYFLRRDYPKAMETLDDLDRLAREMGQKTVSQDVERFKLHCREQMGDLSGLAGWLEKVDQRVEEKMDTERFAELVMAARSLRMLNRKPEASQILDSLLTLAERSGHIDWLINVLALQAAAQKEDGNEPRALAFLEKGLSLAQPEGILRPFLDEGPGMQELLRSAQRRNILPEYTARLLAAYEETFPGKPAPAAAPRPGILSRREVELLHLIADGCSNKEIADRLVISLGTVKRHTVNIFNKLDVKNRTEAVARARELKLL